MGFKSRKWYPSFGAVSPFDSNARRHTSFVRSLSLL